MAFPTPPNQVTGQESVDPSGSLAQYLAQQQAAVTQPAQATPLTIQDPFTGQNTTFANSEELTQYLNGIVQSATAVYQEKERALQEAMARAQGAQPAPTAATAPQKFDKGKYHDMLMEDPFAAQDYLESFHKSRTTQVAEEAYQTAQRLQQVSQNLYREQLNNQFKAQVPDFPWQDQRMTAAVNDIHQRLGLAPTADGYEAAWELVKKRTHYQPQTQSDPRQSVLQFPRQEERAGIPYVPVGGQPLSPGDTEQLRAFASLPEDQRERYVREVGIPSMFGQRGA